MFKILTGLSYKVRRDLVYLMDEYSSGGLIPGRFINNKKEKKVTVEIGDYPPIDFTYRFLYDNMTDAAMIQRSYIEKVAKEYHMKVIMDTKQIVNCVATSYNPGIVRLTFRNTHGEEKDITTCIHKLESVMYRHVAGDFTFTDDHFLTDELPYRLNPIHYSETIQIKECVTTDTHINSILIYDKEHECTVSLSKMEIADIMEEYNAFYPTKVKKLQCLFLNTMYKELNIYPWVRVSVGSEAVDKIKDNMMVFYRVQGYKREKIYTGNDLCDYLHETYNLTPTEIEVVTYDLSKDDRLSLKQRRLVHAVHESRRHRQGRN